MEFCEVVSILFLLFTLISSVLNEEWSAPGVAMDYKVHVDAGKEDCYYQYIEPGAQLYVGFQVLKGGDGMAGFGVRHPNGQFVLNYEWRASQQYQEESSVGGYYAICVDNQFSRFAGKLVNIYISSFRQDKWEKYAQELEAMDLSVQNFTHSLMSVDHRIQEIVQYQQHTRSKESRHYNLLLENNSHVQLWSLIQCVVIAASFIVQVTFVKKLFKEPKAGRPRI